MSKRLEALGRQVASELDREAGAFDETAARERFLRAARRPRNASTVRNVTAVASLVAIAAAVWFVVARRSVVPSYEVAGTRGQVGVELVASGQTPMRFSDGTRVEMAAEAKMRVAALDARGARLVLESGNAHFDLAPTQGARWSVQAGGFEVVGSGAKFTLSFLLPTEELDLSVEQGSVELAGTCVETRAVSAPGHVHLSCAKATTATVNEITPPTPSEIPVAVAPKASGPTHLGWRALAAKSLWNEALAAALAGDFDRECDTDGAADLLALGDVARLAHDAPHARHAYETLRARFPHDPNAAVAAFSLGKLAFDEDHAYGEAGRAFDTYLREQPSGALARDALARSMEAHLRSGDHDTARTLAQRYLERFPGGPQEEVARGIVGK